MLELFPETSFELSGNGTHVELSPVTIGDLPPAVCAAALKEFTEPVFDLSTAIPRCRLSDLSPKLVDLANQLYARVPFKVNCAYRSKEWDLAKGRSGTSSHCKGLAMDVATVNHSQRLHLVTELLALGVRRIGVAKTFIHFDIDPGKAPSMWLYYPDNLAKTF